jgi:hypothetical protein
MSCGAACNIVTRTGFRVLANDRYLAEMKSEPATSRSLLILEGPDSQGIQNLTGEALAVTARKMN